MALCRDSRSVTNRRASARALARLAAGLSAWAMLAGAALAQDVAGSAKAAADAAPIVPTAASDETTSATGPADPLTPPKVELPAMTAPGAPADVTAATVAAPSVEAEPAIVEAKRLLQHGSGGGWQGEDRAALLAFYGENGGRSVWTTAEGLSARAEAAIGELQRAAELGLEPEAFQVKTQAGRHETPAVQAAAEIEIGLAVLKYARHARGGRVDPSQISRMIDVRPQFFDPKSVIASVAASDDVAATMRRFHPQHAGFEHLRLALAQARRNGATAEIIQRIVVNLERWRWMPADLGAFYVFDNVPEQVTRVVKAGQVVLSEKIVVGKPSTPTPFFSANMQFVIFHPSWGVPEGIKNNEVGPLLRRAGGGGGWFSSNDGASRALARYQLRVYQNGRPVNPDSIDWSRVDVRQFSFTQPPSSSNVLGVVKFRFPNRHDVYMHDTPERHLFNGSVRAFSHGCMRVQNPVHLAEVILEHDKGWSADKVRGFVKGGGTAEITLSTQIPVHVAYFTASADESGKLSLHGDIYGMDGRVASALAGRQVHLAAAKAEPSAGEEARSTRRVARARRGEQRAEAPFNPFSGLFGN